MRRRRRDLFDRLAPDDQPRCEFPPPPRSRDHWDRRPTAPSPPAPRDLAPAMPHRTRPRWRRRASRAHRASDGNDFARRTSVGGRCGPARSRAGRGRSHRAGGLVGRRSARAASTHAGSVNASHRGGSPCRRGRVVIVGGSGVSTASRGARARGRGRRPVVAAGRLLRARPAREHHVAQPAPRCQRPIRIAPRHRRPSSPLIMKMPLIAR